MNHFFARGGLRTLCTALLCAMFFFLAMGITLLSSGAYRKIVTTANETEGERTALSYLVNQVRRGDCGVQIGSFGGSDAIVLADGDYMTILYCSDGYLRELYSSVGTGLTAADGTEILELDALSLGVDGGELCITVTQDGAEHSVTLAPRCGIELCGEVSL